MGDCLFVMMFKKVNKSSFGFILGIFGSLSEDVFGRLILCVWDIIVVVLNVLEYLLIVCVYGSLFFCDLIIGMFIVYIFVMCL